jgi:hypothetical protein
MEVSFQLNAVPVTTVKVVPNNSQKDERVGLRMIWNEVEPIQCYTTD